ncbi:carbonic anhydrase [Methanofollis fontis]|uniref:carbonic anhydrase n=1 Tax=Methanofollis fontis TaxID=2052832 RepID=A0A483CXS8_9EURY|nr:carbonic anhydrase [Methanofollis fontis]TAJ44779.1 carbonic anhydrase [Methanofollis fontis]
MIEKFLEGNKSFIEGDFSENRDYYRELASGQKPTVLWIGCSDSRAAPERITGAKSGEIFVHRNIGNIVRVGDWNFATILEYAIKHLKVDDIVICGHSDCGAIKALASDAESDEAYIPLWLSNANQARAELEKTEQKPADPEAQKVWRRKLEEENVKLQIANLRTYPIVREAENAGRVAVHGLYFDLDTGELEKIA